MEAFLNVLSKYGFPLEFFLSGLMLMAYLEEKFLLGKGGSMRSPSDSWNRIHWYADRSLCLLRGFAVINLRP